MVVDEIQKYLDVRYVGPPEVCWRLFEFDMCGKSHTIERLAVHLKERQTIVYERGDEEAALRQADERNTMMTA